FVESLCTADAKTPIVFPVAVTGIDVRQIVPDAQQMRKPLAGGDEIQQFPIQIARGGGGIVAEWRSDMAEQAVLVRMPCNAFLSATVTRRMLAPGLDGRGVRQRQQTGVADGLLRRRAESHVSQC